MELALSGYDISESGGGGGGRWLWKHSPLQQESEAQVGSSETCLTQGPRTALLRELQGSWDRARALEATLWEIKNL